MICLTPEVFSSMQIKEKLNVGDWKKYSLSISTDTGSGVNNNFDTKTHAQRNVGSGNKRTLKQRWLHFGLLLGIYATYLCRFSSSPPPSRCTSRKMLTVRFIDHDISPISKNVANAFISFDVGGTP